MPGGIFEAQSGDEGARWRYLARITQPCVLVTARHEEIGSGAPILLPVVTLLPASPLVSPEGDFGQGPWSSTVSQGDICLMGALQV